jgi:hypothetical protein
MWNKKKTICLLAGLNLVLLLGLLLNSYSIPNAMAQGRGRSGDFSAVTCKVNQNLDVLYVLETTTGRLFGFLPNSSAPNQELKPSDWRDLKQDFSRPK